MKRLLFAVLLMTLFATTPAFSVDPDVEIRCTELKGAVMIAPHSQVEEFGEEVWDTAEMATLSSRIHHFDHVKTWYGSSANIEYASMSAILMKPETNILFWPPQADAYRIALVRGNMLLKGSMLAEDVPFEVETPLFIASIKEEGVFVLSGMIGDFSGQVPGFTDRIRIIRGSAKVFVRETQEKVDVLAGEELSVEYPGKATKQSFDPGREPIF